MANPLSGPIKTLEAFSESVMADTVVIRGPATRTVTDLPSGGWEVNETPAAPVTTIGRIGPVSKTAIERLQADRLEYTGLEQLDVPRDTAVTGEDSVQVTSARHGTTKAYKVEAAVPLGTYSVSRTLIVKAVS